MAVAQPGIEQLRELFQAESNALLEVLSQLSDSQWLTPSPCGNWDVLDLLVHLRMGTGVHSVMVRNSLQGRIEPPFQMEGDPRAQLPAMHRAQREKGAETTLRELRDVLPVYTQTLTEVDDSALQRSAWWWMGEVPLRVVISARIFDLIMHGADIRRALEMSPSFSPEAASFADRVSLASAAGFYRPEMAEGAAGAILQEINGESSQATLNDAGLTLGAPDDTHTATLTTGNGAWALLVWGRISLADAEAQGLVTVTGDHALVERYIGALKTP